jgi:RecB family exonuclease
MARKTKAEMDRLKKQLNTSKIWSYSRVSSFQNCTYSYYLKYIKFIPEKYQNIYSYLGNAFHDVLEKYYNHKIDYAGMNKEVDNILFTTDLSDMVFIKNEYERNEKMKKKYYSCLKHFFDNHVTVPYKVLTEKEILVQIRNQWFIGYIDSIHKEDEIYYITDYKTSTMYAKSQLTKYGQQLILYSLYLIDKGIPLENIVLRWNFLKYLNVQFNHYGKEKTYNYERYNYVERLSRFITKDLRELNLPESLLEQCIKDNSLKLLPQSLQDKYLVGDCYVNIPLTQETINDLKENLNSLIMDIFRLEKEYDMTKKESLWLKTVTDSSSYFCTNLCGYGGHCKCFAEYMEHKQMFNKEHRDDVDFLKQLGLV